MARKRDERRDSLPMAMGAAEAAMIQVDKLLWMPLMAFTSWWNAAVEAWCPPIRAPHTADEEPHELVVPEPIESEGEHALFA